MKQLSFLTIALAGAATATAADPAATEVWTPAVTVVTPGVAGIAPSDALVLFDGNNLDAWVSAADPAREAPWRIADGAVTVKAGAGHIRTRQSFMDYQLHLEWRIPDNVQGAGQHRGNSGVFLAFTGGRLQGYELQVLDCFRNPTYVNGMAGSVYKQRAPLVNACLPPGQWQTYDVIWAAPRFEADGALRTPAHVTVLQNGVVVQNNVTLAGPTLHAGQPRYVPHGPSPILLQDHGDPGPGVSFRNIWLRELAK